MRALALALGLCLVLSQAQALPQPGRPRILLLHSHYQGYSWTDGITEGVHATLTAASKNIDLSVAYLDSRRTMDSAYDAAFASYLESRFQGQRFALVIVADNEALQFVGRHNRGILGSSPLVFCGINDYRPAMVEGLGEVTGVTEEVDMLPTVLVGLALRPRTQRIVVFECDNPTADSLERQFRQEVVAAMDDRLGFVFLRGLSLHEMVAKAEVLAPTDLVVLLNITRDSQGNTIDPGRAAQEISQASPVPVFSFWDFYLGKGILGGRITSGQAQGEDAAGMALRILSGEDISTIPVLRGRASPFVFDWNVLSRFGVALKNLPPGSQILNRPVSLWERHATVFMISGSIILVLLGFVSVLLVLIARKRVAEASLKASEASLLASLGEKEVLLREINHRVKNNLQIMASLLRLGESSTLSEEGHWLLEAASLRIETMAVVHEELYGTGNKSHIDLGSLIERIVDRLQASLSLPGVRIAHPGAGMAGYLALDRALPVCLILDEVVGNSLRHAYPQGRGGEIRIEVALGEGGAWSLVVQDDGCGHPQGFDPAKAASAGYSIVTVLAQQLGASLSFSSGPGGSRLALDFTKGMDSTREPSRSSI